MDGFLQRHGWFVNGLDASGDAWDSSTPTGFFRQHADADAHGPLDGKLTSSRFDLHHIVVLAATFECLDHVDRIKRLVQPTRCLGSR